MPNISTIWKNIFSKFGVSLNVIQAGCCGMSGSFGSETQNASDSKKIFQDNWQEIVKNLGKDQNNIIMVSGSSCKSQIDRFSECKVVNPLVVLSKASI